MANDGSFFSLGDIGTSLGRLVTQTAGTFKSQIATAAQKQTTAVTQSGLQAIVNGLAKAEQDTSKILGLSHPMDLVKQPPQPGAGTVSNVVNKLTGLNLTTWQIAGLSIIILVGVPYIVWMLIRS